MRMADIIVHLDDTKQCASRLDAAISIAVRFKARLTGLYVITHQYYEPHNNRVENSADALRQDFITKTGLAGIEAEWQSADWSVIGIGMTEIIGYYSHFADLVIVGQSKERRKNSYIPGDLPERLVLLAGRPVLTIPFAGQFPSLGERVLVAWKAGRESTRALNDALPLLEKARRVDILMINSTESAKEFKTGHGINICNYLKRHGVNANFEEMTVSGASIADAMLNRACEESFDLLVMGGYTRNSQGKLVLGPVARQLMNQMTLPILMSH